MTTLNLVCIRCGRKDAVPAAYHQYLMDCPCDVCGSLMLGADERVALWIVGYPFTAAGLFTAVMGFLGFCLGFCLWFAWHSR